MNESLKELVNPYSVPNASYGAGAVTVADVPYTYDDPYAEDDQMDGADVNFEYEEGDPLLLEDDYTSEDILTYVGENKEDISIFPDEYDFPDADVDLYDYTDLDVDKSVLLNDENNADMRSDENNSEPDNDENDSGQKSDVNIPASESEGVWVSGKEGQAEFDENNSRTAQFNPGPGGFWVKGIGGGELKGLGGIDFIKNVAKEYGIFSGESWEIKGVPWFHVEPNEYDNYPDLVGRDDELYLGSQSSDIVIGRSEGADNYRILLSYGDDIFIGSKLYENIMGSRGNDVVFCGGGRDEVSLGLGDDVVFAGEGDSVGGGDGVDWYIYSDVTRLGKKFFHEDKESEASEGEEAHKDHGKVGVDYGQEFPEHNHQNDNGFYKCESGGNCEPEEGGNYINDHDPDLYIDLGYAQNGYSFINERTTSIMSFENAVSGKGDDEIYGDDMWGYGGNKLYGMEGNDALFGRSGNDKLYGGKGMDKIEGGDDDDFLHGGDDSDLLLGGEGSDTFFYDASDVNGQDLILDFEDIDTIVLSHDLFINLPKDCLPDWHLTCGATNQWKVTFSGTELEIYFDSKPELTNDHFKIDYDHGVDLAA